MALEQSQILQSLSAVKDPDLHKDIVKLGFVKDVSIDGGRVSFTIELTTPACPVKEQMKEQARAAVLQLPGVTDVAITMTAQVRAAV
jgi:ATP-binding protein involved in chromosome partitioning